MVGIQFFSNPAGGAGAKQRSIEPSAFFTRSSRDERSAICCALWIRRRVSTSYSVADQNCLAGGLGGTRRR
jgi:hypothetical protein